MAPYASVGQHLMLPEGSIFLRRVVENWNCGGYHG